MRLRLYVLPYFEEVDPVVELVEFVVDFGKGVVEVLRYAVEVGVD